MTRASRPFDFDKYEYLLRDPETAAVYLADFLESGDMELFQEGLRHVAKAQEGGIKAVVSPRSHCIQHSPALPSDSPRPF